MRYFFGAMMVLFFLAGIPAGAGAEGGSCKPYALDFGTGDAGWKHVPLSKLKRDTVYTVEENEGRPVLRGVANKAASLYATFVKKGATLPPILAWRWKTDALVPGADNRDKKREDAPLRVLVAFDGDKSTLPEVEQKRFKRAYKLTGKELPYAMLMYIWSDHVPVGTVIASAHSNQVKMLVVASGTTGLGAWQSVRRDFAADYRRMFKADPGPVLGVAVMTDTDNTGTQAVGLYGDIRFECK